MSTADDWIRAYHRGWFPPEILRATRDASMIHSTLVCVTLRAGFVYIQPNDEQLRLRWCQMMTLPPPGGWRVSVYDRDGAMVEDWWPGTTGEVVVRLDDIRDRWNPKRKPKTEPRDRLIVGAGSPRFVKRESTAQRGVEVSWTTDDRDTFRVWVNDSQIRTLTRGQLEAFGADLISVSGQLTERWISQAMRSGTIPKTRDAVIKIRRPTNGRPHTRPDGQLVRDLGHGLVTEVDEQDGRTPFGGVAFGAIHQLNRIVDPEA